MSDQTHRVFVDAFHIFASYLVTDETTAEEIRLRLRGYPNAAAYDRAGGSSENLTPDPTGEQATVPDRANRDLKRRAKLAGQFWALAVELDDIRRAYASINPRQARALAADDPAQWCRAHLEHGVHAERWRGDQCRSCYERRLDPPTHAELAHHAAHGKWPGVRVKPGKGKR